MRLIRPVPVTDANYVGSSLTEAEYGTYNPATAYATSARVIKNHVIYESVVTPGTNTGNDPALESNRTKWLVVGPTNRWSAWDTSVGTKATSPNGTMYMTVKPGEIDSIAVLDLQATGVTLDIMTGSTVNYTRTESAADTNLISDWWTFFTAPITPKSAVIFYDLPLYPDANYRLTINNSLDVSAVGTIVYGRMYNIGLTQPGASFGIVSFSEKKQNSYGVISVKPGGFARRITAKIELENLKLGEVDRVLTAVRDTPVVWIGGDGSYDPLIAYGFYKDWSVDIPYPYHSFCNLQIEGLV